MGAAMQDIKYIMAEKSRPQKKQTHYVTMTLPGACAHSEAVRPIVEFHLGPTGASVEKFCTEFDDRTAAAEIFNWPVKVWIHVFDDQSFAFEFTRSQMLGSPVSFRVQDLYLDMK